MAKMKRSLKNLGIVPTFTLYTLIAVLLAIFITECITTFVDNFQKDIAFEYSDIVKGYTNEKIWGENEEIIYFSPSDSSKVRIAQNIEHTLVTLTYVLCSLSSAVLFYRHKIKTPLALLTSSTNKIAKNELDFTVHYDKSDEMGKLCDAFEKMRGELEKNTLEMWRQMDDRKKLNAAFSHDLRTPLTVLEGNLDILQQYSHSGRLSNEDMIETYNAMSSQINRLKNYVSSMSTLQRLEDIPIDAKTVESKSFINSLESTANIVCSKNDLVFIHKITMQQLTIDTEIIMQVFENLLANAIRYAKNKVSINCKIENDNLLLIVVDDGNGFNEKSLRYASYPFYTTEKKSDNIHFGIGLSICKILCNRHGGDISFCNNENGGGSVTATFSM